MAGGGETIKAFLVSLGFKVDAAGHNKFKGALGEAEHAAHGLKHGLSELANESGLLGGELAGIGRFLIGPGGFVVGCLAATGALFGLVNEQTRELDTLNDLHLRVGMASSEIEEFGFAASQCDSSVAEANAGLEGLQRTLGEAALGLGRGKMTFEKLGLAAHDSSGRMKTTSEILEEVREKVKSMSDPEARAALQKLGMSPNLLMTLRGTGEAAMKFAAQLDEAFGVDLDKLTQDASDYRDVQGQIAKAIETAKEAITQAFLPAARKMVDWFKDMVLRYGPGLVDVLTGLGYIAMGVSEIIVDALMAVWNVIKFFLAPIFALLDEIFGEGQGALIAFAVALGLLASTVSAPVLAVAALIAGLALLYEHWDEISETFSNSSFGKAAIAALTAIRSVITDVIDSVAKLISGFGKLFSGDFKGAFGDVMGIVGNIGNSLKTMAPALPPGAATVGSLMQAGATNATNIVQNFNGNADPAVVQRAAQNGAERGARNSQNPAAVPARG